MCDIKSNNCQNLLSGKRFCFFCSYLIKPNAKFNVLTYNSNPVKICTQCKPKAHKPLEIKYKSALIDCKICSKKVQNRNNIHCKLCNHFVHAKCANLDNKDINKIENIQQNWFCPPCTEEILPLNLIEEDHKEAGKNLTNKNKSEIVNQCFTCTTNLYKKHSNKAIYNENYVNFCDNCFLYPPVKNKNLLEFIDCPQCSNLVEYESILCSICNHWNHPNCVGLTFKDINNMSGEKYGDWIYIHPA